MTHQTDAPALLRVCEWPRISVVADFIDLPTAHLLADLARDDGALQAADAVLSVDETGRAATIAVAEHALLGPLVVRISGVLGVDTGATTRVVMRHHRVTEGYPPRIDGAEREPDTGSLGTSRLLATAELCVVAPKSGGETIFLHAADCPIAIRPTVGQLTTWRNIAANGDVDVLAEHRGADVTDGEKITFSAHFFADAAAAAGAAIDRHAPPDLRAAVRPRGPVGDLRGFGRALAVIDDGVPEETVDLLEAAAEERGIRVLRLDPRRFDFSPSRRLRPGDMLYRPAISMHSARVEQHLWTEHIGSFYLDPDGPYFSNINAMATFSRAGLAVPRTFWLTNGDRDLLRSYVEQLGGLPVVVKALGYSRGVGTIRADSLASLFSIVDYALVGGGRPLLTSYVPDAVHWRLVVVGDQVVSTYRNVTDDDDFRTSGSDELEDYLATPPEGANELAIRACHALRHAHGGVDVLEHPSGRLYVLEANFPCYYATAQLEAGVDVAGPMVDYLLDRAIALAPVSSEPIPNNVMTM